jgi:hypothetical protein
MQKIDPQILTSINRILEKDGEIVVAAYSLLERTEDVARYILLRLFEKHGKTELLDPIFSSLKELTTNAIKANIKKLLMVEGKISDNSDPMSAVQAIKSVLNEKSLLEYGIKCWNNKLSIRIHFVLKNNNLIIKVIDPYPLTPDIHARIQSKIERAKSYENLAMCYLENPDPLAEGMGLGLSMVVVLLKGSGINLDDFSITSDETRKTTTAQIIIRF